MLSSEQHDDGMLYYSIIAVPTLYSIIEEGNEKDVQG